MKTPNSSDRMPSGIPYIIGNEGAERFSYYGMRAILKVYLILLLTEFVKESMIPPDVLAGATARSTEVVHLFFAGVYAFPLLGAIVADRLLGKYRTIMWVSLIYCAGHAVLAIAGRYGAIKEFSTAQTLMYWGLGLIALGSGGIKPCVSANVGDQFTAANAHLVTKVFQIFYFIINYGSFFSTVLTPLLLRRYGAEVAFGVPGILMGIATIVFWLGRNKFIQVPAKPGGRLGLFDSVVTTLLFSPLFALIVGYFVLWEQFLAAAEETDKRLGLEFAGVTGKLIGEYFVQYWWLPLGTAVAVGIGFVLFAMRQRIEASAGFLPVLLYNFTHQRERQPGMGFFDVGRARYGEEAGDGPPAVLKIMVVFSMVSVFWALYDQHASTWIDQAKLMGLTLIVPAYFGYWLLAATLGLSVFAGVWLFCWIANMPLPRMVTRVVLAAVIATGALAVVLDQVGPAIGTVVDLAAEKPVSGRELKVDMDAAQLSAINPLFVMIVIPALNFLVFMPLSKRGIEIKPLQKMTVGMFLTALAFVAAAILQQVIQAAGKGEVHSLWQIVQYFIMTVAEVLVSVTGLEFAYTQAPRMMKSTIMGFWLLCVTFGNLLVAFLAPLQKTLPLSSFFWLFAGLMAVAATIFLFLAMFYKGKTYLQN